MLLDENRLRKNIDFVAVYKNGKVYSSRFFVLRYLQRKNPGKTRIGIAPPKRIKKAVDRNRIKRQVRALFKEEKEGIRDNLDLVVNIKYDALTANYFDLKKDFKDILQKSRIVS